MYVDLRVVIQLKVNCEMCFVFLIAPESYEELRSLLSGRSTEEQLLVVERIQKCNHPSLAVGNKAKLEVRWDTFVGVGILACSYFYGF